MFCCPHKSAIWEPVVLRSISPRYIATDTAPRHLPSRSEYRRLVLALQPNTFISFSSPSTPSLHTPSITRTISFRTPFPPFPVPFPPTYPVHSPRTGYVPLPSTHPFPQHPIPLLPYPSTHRVPPSPLYPPNPLPRTPPTTLPPPSTPYPLQPPHATFHVLSHVLLPPHPFHPPRTPSTHSLPNHLFPTPVPLTYPYPFQPTPIPLLSIPRASSSLSRAPFTLHHTYHSSPPCFSPPPPFISRSSLHQRIPVDAPSVSEYIDES